jgi:hypothetical protein
MSGKHTPDPAFLICATFAVVLCVAIGFWWLMLGK